MTATNIILYLIFGGIIFLYLNRFHMKRFVPQLSAAEVSNKIQLREPVILLDVRTEAEHHSGHIKGSLHIPLHELSSRSGELSKHKDKEIICYCQSGSRSVSATAMLQKDGYHAYNMDGGISEWNFLRLR